MDDKETLREAVARALCELRIRTIRRHDTPPDELEAMLPAAVNHVWREHLPQADAAIATMFERLRTPSDGMIEFAAQRIYETSDTTRMFAHGRAHTAFQIVAEALQQENSDA